MLKITKYFSIFVYAIAVLMFGIYIKLYEIADLFSCFACKEMDKLLPSYDYIVVGSGSAGSVVALRLTQDKLSTVLVLEAGAHSNSWLDIPAVSPLLQLSTIDWQYQTEPQENAALGLNNKRSKWPMGRVVGGTAALNNMIHVRGHRKDFEEWYKDDDCYSYSKDILPFFKKSENYRGLYQNETKYHTSGGPLLVQGLNFVSSLGNAILKAAELLGYRVTDLNGEYNTGFMQIEANTHLGSRWTTAHYLLRQNKHNLRIQTNTLVQRVLFKSAFEAYAVKYSYLGQNLIVRANKGIILSAGTIGTPKILMQSGVGPRDHLKSVGIKNKIHLPVGNNLQDHVTTGLDLVVLNETLGIGVTNMMSLFAGYKYFAHSSGPWTTVGCEVVGIVNTYCYDLYDDVKKLSSQNYKTNNEFKLQTCTNISKAQTSKKLDILKKFLPKVVKRKRTKVLKGLQDKENLVCSDNPNHKPDLQFMVMVTGISVDGGNHLYKAVGIKETVWKQYFSHLVHKTTVSILPIVLHPKSVGTIRLLNKNPQTKPLIDPKYLTKDYDVEILLKGISIIKKLVATEPMQKLGAKINDRKFPGCEHLRFDTMNYWECYVRHLTLTSFHPVGTCKMGSKTDNTTVVGYDFKVHGTNKLYVADASVIPSLPSGNPNAVVVMIAEKVASVIMHHQYLNQRVTYKKEMLVPKRYRKTG